MKKVFLLIIFSVFTFNYLTGEDRKPSTGNSNPVTFYSLKDTVYTFKQFFFEIDLSRQMGYLHSKDSIFEFKISSGTKAVYKGVDTKEGLFVIQSKANKIYSQQFDSTLMLKWMGFNFGIGFHALLGNGYYNFLGVKKSSHGCIRISREDAVALYDKIELGIPVLVHSGNSAVQIAFGDSSRQYAYYSFNMLKEILKKRYEALYTGKYFEEVKHKLLIDRGNVFHSGLPLGDSDKISPYQIYKPWVVKVDHLIENHFANAANDSLNFPNILLD